VDPIVAVAPMASAPEWRRVAMPMGRKARAGWVALAATVVPADAVRPESRASVETGRMADASIKELALPCRTNQTTYGMDFHPHFTRIAWNTRYGEHLQTRRTQKGKNADRTHNRRMTCTIHHCTGCVRPAGALLIKLLIQKFIVAQIYE